MKVVILAGGFGTRLAEETEVIPKPMVEIGGRPILWHIMNHYAYFGFKEFIIALGYKGEIVKRYFLDYYAMSSNLSVNLSDGSVSLDNHRSENWVIHLVDTGLNSMTGGRIKRLQSWLDDETFMVTYGDGVSNINLTDLLQFHQNHQTIGTVSAVRPPARFGGLTFDGDHISQFIEKPQIGEGWINGGFMVFEPELFNYLDGDDDGLEKDALERLATERQLVAFRHANFWQCMDTLRDKRLLEDLWRKGIAPWRVWT